VSDPSGGPLRRGGRGRQVDGALLTWSIAEGARGRRWRGTTTVDGILHQACVLETDGEGRPGRLEIASNAGLLTLHPGPDDRELHGNVVTPRGIRHLRFAWSPAHELLVEGLTLASVAIAWRLSGEVPVGEGIERHAVLVASTLECREDVARFERLALAAWRIRAGALTMDARAEPNGVPGLDDAADWPLEL
jgi:hypothetical protein